MSLDCGSGIFTSSDELASTHLLGILFLVGAVGDSGNIGAHGFGEDESEMSQSTNTNHTDLFGGFSSSVLFQGRVDSDTTTKHRRGFGRIERVGNVDGEMRWSSPLVGVTTLTLVPFSVRTTRKFGSVGTTNTARAVILSAFTVSS